MTRRTPDESAVREQLRDRDYEDGVPAGAAAPGTPEETGEQPEAGGAEAAGTEAAGTDAGDAEPEQQGAPRDPLAEAEAKRDEYLDLARRTQADFENYRKRAVAQAAQAGERAKVGLLRELLPVVDNLERAEAAAADSEGPLHEGVKLVLADLQGVLAREGVEAIEPKGEPFDPNVHEALSMAQLEGTESGVVVEVVEKGYRSRDTVIRPARVVVSS